MQKSGALEQIKKYFETKHNQIILYQQLNSDKNFCVGWPGS